MCPENDHGHGFKMRKACGKSTFSVGAEKGLENNSEEAKNVFPNDLISYKLSQCSSTGNLVLKSNFKKRLIV